MSEQRIKLLLVEDDRVDRMAFERMVRAEGLPYDYTCVSSIDAGKKAVKSDTFDVIVTDYRLGDGTAFDLIGEVPREIPVVLVTGAGGEEVAVQAMKAGASDYLMKDVNGNYLKTLPITVSNTIKAKATERELKRYHEQLEKLVEERTQQLQETNKELKREIEERTRAEEALRVAHDKLEIRVAERTSELRQSNAQLLDEIAERQRAEMNLQKSKETVEAILNATNDCAFLLEIDGAFVTLNPTTAETLDAPIENLLGKSYFDLIPPAIAQFRKAKFNEVASSGKGVRFEDRGMDKIFDHSYHPVFDSDGSVERVAVFCRDITEQKKSQEQSVQKQRLAALGEMAGGVAHNFNNLLQIVIGAAGLAESDLDVGDFEEVRKTLIQIAESAQLGSETVKQLQDFARVRTEDPTVAGKIFDLSATVSRAIEVSKPFWKSGPEKRGVAIEMTSRLAEGCFVKGHENELFEVIVNLVKNATEALPKGGKVACKTFVERESTVLQVCDTGTGMPKDNLTKVFEPFWTTKGVQGTGMGLSTSFGIVGRHGGLISVQSWEGKGTIFTVKLPLTVKQAAPAIASTEPIANFKARFLIIDDQVRLVELMEKALTRYGQIVFKASSGREGIELFQETEVDMVICDLGMPGMNGWHVAKAVKDICARRGVPKTPVILLTGWGGQLEEREMIEKCSVDRIVEKPIRYPVLFEVIRGLIPENGRQKRKRSRSAESA
ncbi:MAG: response regulator [Desulfomonile tiedjei]|nr:response regulator [Desulfomonile tiedjei]